jgi:hypothetical protein
VSFRLIPHSKKEITTFAKAKINGATYSGHTDEVSNY